MKKDTTALNIRIDTSLYNLLQDATKTGQSKTYLVETALRRYLNVDDSTNTDETEGDASGTSKALRATLEHTVQFLTKEIEHLKGIVKPQEELLAVTGTDKPQRTASLNTLPKSFGVAVRSLLKEESEAASQLESEIEPETPVTLLASEEESAIAATKNEFSEPFPKNPPSELPPEDTKDTSQEDFPLSSPEPLEEAKTEENPSDWMEPSQFAEHLSGILGEEITVKKLTDKVAKTKPEAKKETENGFIFDFRGLTVERKKASAKRNHYRLIGKV